MIYSIKYKTRDGFCEFDHNGECLTCDCWASDCAFVRMENEDHKYETDKDFERMFGYKEVDEEIFFKELYAIYQKVWNENGEPGLTLLVKRTDNVSQTMKIPDFLFKDVILVDENLASQIGLTLTKTSIMNHLQIILENSKVQYEMIKYDENETTTL
jgi:hypothetical protein